jgi:hypothetical protein
LKTTFFSGYAFSSSKIREEKIQAAKEFESVFGNISITEDSSTSTPSYP